MRRVRAIAIAAVVVLAASPAQPDITVPSMLQVLGSVTNAARPVANALVIALNLSTLDAIQTYTSADGSFELPPLRSGIYRIIAVKAGFVPATTTVVPTKNDHRLTLRMAAEKTGVKSASQDIWEIRGSLPPDILRDLDSVMTPPMQMATYQVPRLRGEMVSMTGVGDQTSRPAFAQTALDVQSRIGETWQIGIRGDISRFDDPTDNDRFGSAAAESSVMSMELRSSPRESYRVASTRTWWRYRQPTNEPAPRDAGVRSHDFEWEHGDSRVKVRYFAHDNVFRDESSLGSNLIEIAGDTPLIQTRRNDLGVSLRVRQESLRSAGAATFRTADVAANGKLELAPAFMLHYGMASRLGIDRSELAPSSGFSWRFGKETSLIGSFSYKLYDTASTATLPALLVWSDDLSDLPRYSYSFGIVSSRDESNQLSAIATVSAADSPLRVVFNDPFQQFWDGLYVETGDVRRDVRLAYRRQFGEALAVDVATTAGTATPRTQGQLQKVYVTGDVQTFFRPTRTSLAVSYREIQQPQPDLSGDYHSERVNVRMAQSLYLPIDVRVLVGIELVRAENSPFLLDTLLHEDGSRKYIGGLAVNF